MIHPRRVEPGPGQESVWDYPRPPRLEETSRLIRVEFGGEVVAESRRAWRVLETSHPPVYYIPPGDVRLGFLHRSSAGETACEWKGRGIYHSLLVGDRRSADAAWSYPDPTPEFAPIRGYLAFYPGRVDACTVDGVIVRPQEGGFYGGWITPDVAGPFKGGPGSWGW
jgi:uncharacterized protein (DUF427 family)